MNICCPKCESNSLIAYDNQPLYHHDGVDNEIPKIDTELYMSLRCLNLNCGHEFTQVFDLVPRSPRPKSEKHKFDVTVVRTSYAQTTVGVVAHNAMEAEKIARELCGDLDYREFNADYNIESVTKKESYE